MSQIGNSVGLTVGAVIAASVTVTQAVSRKPTSEKEAALDKGFQAAFWACGASMALVVVVSLVGLKRAGKVGLKAD